MSLQPRKSSASLKHSNETEITWASMVSWILRFHATKITGFWYSFSKDWLTELHAYSNATMRRKMYQREIIKAVKFAKASSDWHKEHVM